MTKISPAFAVFAASIGFLYKTAKDFKKDAIILKNGTDYCTPSFHLLSSVALELLPKVLVAIDVCMKYGDKSEQEITQEQIIDEIRREAGTYGHNLEKLYKAHPDLMTYLDLEDVQEFPPVKPDKDYYMWEYRFKLKGVNGLISIKNIEAIRYGSFAKKPDVMLDCTGDHYIIQLLNKVDEYVLTKDKDAREKLIGLCNPVC